MSNGVVHISTGCTPIASGRMMGVTIIEDEVQYALPYAPLGELVYPLVRLQLHRIFRYRQHAIRAYFFEGTRQH
jgi:hypothetical protein